LDSIKNGRLSRVTSALSADALRGGTILLDGEYGGLGANYKI
jgi:hypothetical protein